MRKMDIVVHFYPWFKYFFPLFCGMVINADEFETKSNSTQRLHSLTKEDRLQVLNC